MMQMLEITLAILAGVTALAFGVSRLLALIQRRTHDDDPS